MSKRWPGGIVTKTQATPTGPYENSSAPGIWTLNQMSYWVKQALWPTAGNVNPNFFIENLFSTYLYTGNGTSQTITNGINLSGQGGLTWIKSRSDATENLLYDTSRGAFNYLISSSIGAQSNGSPTGLSAFNTTGFNVAGTTIGGGVNGSGATYVSWTFREQPKFFDVVTFTGDGTTNKVINHSLGSTPGFIVVKRTDSTGDWGCWHNAFTPKQTIFLNQTTAIQTYPSATDITINATSFTIGTNQIFGNSSGATYVAYLFAHNAGGFGLSGTENVISCGSMTFGGTSIQSFNLGYEPQWLLVKKTDGAQGWWLFDNMRGMSYSSALGLQPNVSNAETNFGSNGVYPTATGVDIETSNFGSGTYIYIAIRRGPMQVPTLGTSVFSPRAVTEAMNLNTVNLGITSDLVIAKPGRASNTAFNAVFDRLRGMPLELRTNSTNAELNYANGTFGAGQTSVTWPSIENSVPLIQWVFKRAAGFFDVVCYTGTGSLRTVNHNLGVAPELMIVKSRSRTGEDWPILTGASYDKFMYLNQTIASALGIDAYNCFGNGSSVTVPTSTVFTVGTQTLTNSNTYTYVAYLFATVAGVSKVGSYTGTGATLNINAGFTTGARFVMIKRTDSTGNWYVWDTARGMVAGTDPKLALNSTAAESNADWVYTASSGFQIVTTDASVNASGGSYIYLAIA